MKNGENNILIISLNQHNFIAYFQENSFMDRSKL